MRQAGVLAAAALVALEEGPKRLYIDHENARFFGAGIGQYPAAFASSRKKFRPTS